MQESFRWYQCSVGYSPPPPALPPPPPAGISVPAITSVVSVSTCKDPSPDTSAVPVSTCKDPPLTPGLCLLQEQNPDFRQKQHKYLNNINQINHSWFMEFNVPSISNKNEITTSAFTNSILLKTTDRPFTAQHKSRPSPSMVQCMHNATPHTGKMERKRKKKKKTKKEAKTMKLERNK